jgi:putative transposase
VLAKHYRPEDPGSDGPSWLTLIAQAKDSLWTIDMFRCESILLRSFWVMVVGCIQPPHHRVWRRAR